MRQLIAIIMAFGMVATARAGLTIDKLNKVKFGKVTVEGTIIVIEIRLGTTAVKQRPAKDMLKWWTDKEEVVDYYTGGKQAFEDKKYDIAKVLASASLRKEPRNKANAQALLSKIASAPKDGSTDTSGTETDPKPDGGADAAVTNIGSGNGKLYATLKDHLLDAKTGKKFDSKTWGNAEYYLVCFISLKFAENRDVLRRVIGQYPAIKKDYKGKVELLFYPIDRDAKVLTLHIPKLKIPFPILKRAIAAKTSLLKHKTSSACFAIVDASGNMVFKGDNQHRLLVQLEDKMDE